VHVFFVIIIYYNLLRQDKRCCVSEMKKKSIDAKFNPGYNCSGSWGGVVDRQLIQRVEQASQSVLAKSIFREIHVH